MPRIRPYTPQVGLPNPSPVRQEIVSSGTGEGARFLGKTISDVSDTLLKVANREEASSVSQELAQVNAEYTAKFQDHVRTADPGDKTLVDRFMQDYDARVAKIEENIGTASGRQQFQDLNTRYRSHFLTSGLSTQAQLSGEKAVDDFKREIGSNSAALLANPNSFDTVMSTLQASVESRVQNGLPRSAALKLQYAGEQSYVESKIRGWVKLDPNDELPIAKQELDSGKYDQYLTGDLKKQLYGELEQEVRARRAQKEHDVRFSFFEKQKNDERVANEMLNKLMDGTLSKDDIRNSAVDYRIREHFISALGSGRLTRDSTVYNDLYSRMVLPDGDPNQITSVDQITAYLGKGIDAKQSESLIGVFKRRLSVNGRTELATVNTFLKNEAQPLITKGMLGVDPVLTKNYGNFTQEFYAAFDEGRKNGVAVKDLLATQGPHSLYPIVLKYRPTLDDELKNMDYRLGNEKNVLPPQPSGVTAPALPRQPNESPADYLKRKKGAGN